MSRTATTILITLLLVALIAAVVLKPNPPEKSLSTFTYQPMGTYCNMTIATPNDQPSAQVAANAALAKIHQIESLASTYQPQSEISQLANLKPNSPSLLSAQMYPVFERSLYYSHLTDGAFDITVGPLMNLWRTAVKRDTLPSADQIATTLQAVGYRNITLDPQARTITFSQPHMSITLDAIVKGHAADIAVDAIRQLGVSAALIDLGGDIVCYGAPPGRSAWNIGIQDPFKPASSPKGGPYLAIIALTDAAVATSGNYQRTFTIQDQTYSQIIDPRTGQPVEQAPSVTIIAPTAADADALATACSVLPVAQALQLIDKIPHTEALLITGSPDAPVFHRSTGFDDYLRTPLPN